MKKKTKIILGVFIIIAAFLLYIRNHNAMFAKIIIGESSIYSKEEIKEAINIVLEKFKEYPAYLKRLEYNEQMSSEFSDDWAKQYGAEEAIILYSDFRTYIDRSTYKFGFSPNQKHHNWSWTLVRIDKENWQLKCWGYG